MGFAPILQLLSPAFPALSMFVHEKDASHILQPHFQRPSLVKEGLVCKRAILGATIHFRAVPLDAKCICLATISLSVEPCLQYKPISMSPYFFVFSRIVFIISFPTFVASANLGSKNF